MSDQAAVAPPAAGEGVAASAGRSGFWRRFGAVLVDGILLGIVGWVVGQVFGQDVTTVEDGTASYSISGGAAGVLLLVNLAYFVVMEGGSGATLGKRALGIRVVDSTSGGPIGYGSALVRWFARYLSALPFMLGYLWMLWDDNKQTWHDKLAHAVVVRN